MARTPACLDTVTDTVKSAEEGWHRSAQVVPWLAVHPRCAMPCCSCVTLCLQVIWSQLLFEPLSRVDACITPGRDTQLSSRLVGADIAAVAAIVTSL